MKTNVVSNFSPCYTVLGWQNISLLLKIGDHFSNVNNFQFVSCKLFALFHVIESSDSIFELCY